jgi:hypothetical protein
LSPPLKEDSRKRPAFTSPHLRGNKQRLLLLLDPLDETATSCQSYSPRCERPQGHKELQVSIHPHDCASNYRESEPQRKSREIAQAPPLHYSLNGTSPTPPIFSKWPDKKTRRETQVPFPPLGVNNPTRVAKNQVGNDLTSSKGEHVAKRARGCRV